MKNAVERIRHSVREGAEAEAAHTLREAREELDQRVAAAREEEEHKALAAVEGERQRLAQEEFREVSRAQRAMRLSLLAARNRVIEEIFSMARGETLRMPADRYRKIMQHWLAEVDVPRGGEVLPAARDAALIEGLVAEMNRSRPPEAAFALSKERAPFESGFIVRTPGFEIERSLEGWIEEQKRELAPRLERELFGDARDAHAE
jgi:vacuolar-type H+-ATPase subunit E/Vma4